MTPEYLIAHAPDEAIARITADLAHDPDDVGTLCQLARAQLAADRPGAALAAADRAVAQAARQSYPLSVRSAVLSRLGRHDEAVEAARLAVRLDPRNPKRHDRATWALLAAGEQVRDAEQSALTALTLAPEEVDLWFSYALVLAHTHRRSETRRALLHVLASDPAHAAARHEMAALETGRTPAPAAVARGSEGYAEAVRRDPEPARARLGGTLRGFLQLTAVLLALLPLAAFRFAQNDHPAAARWTAVLAVLVPLAPAGWFLARGNPADRPHLRAVAGRQARPLLLAGASAVLVLTAVAGPEAWLSWLLGSAAVGGVLVWVTTASAAPAAVELPYALGRTALTLVLAACLVLAVVCLYAARVTGQPALDLTAMLLTVAGFVVGRVIVKRGRIADSA